MNWKFKPLTDVEKDNAALRTTIVQLRHQLKTKQGYVQRLQVLLCSRLQTIDELNGKLDQLRHQNRRLDAENEHLVEMVRLSPDPL